MNDKVTISYDLEPLNIDDVKCSMEIALLLADDLENTLLRGKKTPTTEMACAQLFALQQHLQALDRHAEATLEAEFAAEREGQNHLLQDKKKSAPTAGTADAPNPQRGALVSASSIAQTEGKGK